MTRLLMTIGFVAAALPALADATAPGLYRVVGVASKLNVRGEPDRGAAIVGSLASDAADIEVVQTDPAGEWGHINIGEGTGWVNLAYLESQGALWEANALPETLRCFGTEPFWDLRREGDGLVRGGAGEQDRPLAIDTVTGAAGLGSRVVVARDAEGSVTLGIAPELCSDGMSDRAFGLGALLSEGNAPALTGCCSVTPR
jgi:uncharacterized membrane protein